MGRRKTVTTFGQRGGTGPNAGRKAVHFSAVAPDGTHLTHRSFQSESKMLPECGIAALLPPYNGHTWLFWTVAASVETMPEFVKQAVQVGSTVVYVPYQRVDKSLPIGRHCPAAPRFNSRRVPVPKRGA